MVLWGWLEGFCLLAGRLGAGLGWVLEDDEVEVKLEVELEDAELEPELLELDPEPLGVPLVVVVVVVLDELLLSGTQFSVLEVTTPATGGSFRLETGVPGATLETVNV